MGTGTVGCGFGSHHLPWRSSGGRDYREHHQPCVGCAPAAHRVRLCSPQETDECGATAPGEVVKERSLADDLAVFMSEPARSIPRLRATLERFSALSGQRVNVGKSAILLLGRDEHDAGQGATDVTTFHSQRLRWAEGNLTILRHDNPLTMRGLDIKQRLTYFASIIHWGGGIPRLILYLTPLMMLLSGVSPVKEFTPTLAAVFISYIGMMMLALRSVYRGYTNYDLVEFFNMANFWTQILATWRAVFSKR